MITQFMNSFRTISAAAKLAIAGLLSISLFGCRTVATPAVDAAASQAEGNPTGLQSYAVAAGSGIDDLVRMALENHPEIDAAEAKVRRMMAKVPQAKALPDPKMRISAGSMAETAAGRVGWMTGVEQALPFPGKLREMARAAGKEAEAAAAQLEAVQLEIAAQVRRAYWSQFLAVQTTAITQDSRDALNLIRDSVDARAAANQADQGDQLRLSTEIGKVEAALVRSRQGEGSAKSRMNALLNRPSSAPLPAPKLNRREFGRDLNSLLAKAESEHPEVKAARAELEAFQHRLKRAELDRYPDFALGLQHASVSDGGLAPSANGRDQVFATLGITLPIWQEPSRSAGSTSPKRTRREDRNTRPCSGSGTRSSPPDIVATLARGVPPTRTGTSGPGHRRNAVDVRGTPWPHFRDGFQARDPRKVLRCSRSSGSAIARPTWPARRVPARLPRPAWPP